MKIITQFTSIELFSTERLYAYRIKVNDLEKFISMHNHPEVMATLGGLRGEEETRVNFQSDLDHWQENGFGLWQFYLKDTQAWVGRAGLHRVQIAGNEEIELAYALMPEFWHLGLATEMGKACAEIAFEVLRLDQLVCFTLTTNKSSKRVMEKVGFQYEQNFEHANLPHVLYRMKNPHKVEVIPYDAAWVNFFNQEASCIQQVLGNHLQAIEHIGSTAIPGMPAKPIIDILLICHDFDEIDLIAEKLQSLNYLNLRRQIIPHQSFFVRKQSHPVGFHLHLHAKGSPQIKRHINFRDYVIQHIEEAQAYAALKVELARQFANDINHYVTGKDKLVQAIDAKAKLWDQRKRDFLPENTGLEAKDWSQEKITKAMSSNFNVQMTHFAQFINQIELIRIPGYTIVNSGLSDETFNYVLDADFSSGEAHKKIAEVTNYFKSKNIPYSWWVSPLDKPENLTAQLEKYGYRNRENQIAMFLDLDAWNEEVVLKPELKIICVHDERTLQDFAKVLSTDLSIFQKYFSWVTSILTDDDPIKFYVGYVNGIPVVRGLTCYFAQVAGLYWLATDLNKRDQGYGTAMQQYQLKQAKKLGYHIAFCQISADCYALYKKMGFQECGHFREFKLKES